MTDIFLLQTFDIFGRSRIHPGVIWDHFRIFCNMRRKSNTYPGTIYLQSACRHQISNKCVLAKCVLTRTSQHICTFVLLVRVRTDTKNEGAFLGAISLAKCMRTKKTTPSQELAFGRVRADTRDPAKICGPLFCIVCTATRKPTLPRTIAWQSARQHTRNNNCLGTLYFQSARKKHDDLRGTISW